MTPADEGIAAARRDAYEARQKVTRRTRRNDSLWVVTTPTEDSELADICFQATARDLIYQGLGGLAPDEVEGSFSDGNVAHAFARRLLKNRK